MEAHVSFAIQFFSLNINTKTKLGQREHHPGKDPAPCQKVDAN